MKKSTKKVLSGVLALSIGASLLAGCSNGDEKATNDNSKKPSDKPVQTAELKPEQGAKLVLWDNGDSEGEFAKYVAKEFTKKYNVPVKVEKVNHTDSAAKIEAGGPTGKGADVFDAAHDHVGNMEVAGSIFPNMSGDDYKNRFVDAAITGTSGKDGFYGFPLAVETYALYYNKELVKEPAKTMEELFAQAKEFQKGSTSKNPKYGLMLEPGNFYFNYAFMGANGGYVFGENKDGGFDTKDLGLNSEGAIKSGEFMKKIHDELLPLKKEDINGDLISTMFNEGKLMYRISGPWDIKNHQDAKVNFGVTTLPALENGKIPTSFSGIKAYYVSVYTKYPKAATLLAQFATSDEMLQKRYELTGQLPPSKKLLESEAIKKDEILSGFAKQLEHSVPMPNIAEMQKVWGPMENAYSAIWNGLATPKASLDSATKQIQDSIKAEKK
ncbi:maltose ABC transporter substrate-binding protein [Bacillus cereus]|uniref:sugar ABC transporter substrate-binding protein n=1 Tax=Bacillus cereus TaxID=1396 RepID=UPI000BFD452B|nr:maltose ABC transporter substrate-binding protein [Bacillus cereus]PGP11606.1 maltose ABC transporter substrate-binding protein [Bacillus cereus]